MAHLTSFTVENFKRFEHFEMNNIGQFNLIVGDNNVGKTSVLEALLIVNSAQVYAWRLKTVLRDFWKFEKPKQSYFTYFINQNDPNWARNSTVVFRCVPEYEIRISLDENSLQNGLRWLWIPYGIVDGQGQSEYLEYGNQLPQYRYLLPYIPFVHGYEHMLADILQEEIYTSSNFEEQLRQDMLLLIPKLKGFRISTIHSETPVIVVSQEGLEPSLTLASFGAGSIKLFRILIEIIRSAGKRLMIDEIDAGIHINRFKGFWRIILKSALEHNVQLFATTHNWECLQVFKEVLEEPEMVQYQERARCFKLAEMPDGSVKSYTYEFDDFQYAMEARLDPREVWG